MKNRPRLRIFLIELGICMLLTLWLMIRTADGRSVDETPWEYGRIVGCTTLGVIAGPMTGALARDGHSHFVAHSLSLLPVPGAILAAGVLLQFPPLPTGPKFRWLRNLAWGLGWFGWFASGVLSLLYAVE